MKLAAFVLALGACAGEPAPPAPAAEPAPAWTAASAPAVVVVDAALVQARQRGHDVLSRDCGECHEGHRPTAKPPALAVFDLDAPDWQVRFDDRRFAVAVNRFAKKPAADRDAFVAFRDAELAARRR